MESISRPGGRRLQQTAAGSVKVEPSTMEGASVREQDRFLPIANVIRIMRRVLPPHAKISDDAKETIQECLSEYISFITSEANERCKQEQRKIITAEDLLWAMGQLGFDAYIQPLTLYLRRYREAEGGSLHREIITNPLKRAASNAGLVNPVNHRHHSLRFFFQPQSSILLSPLEGKEQIWERSSVDGGESSQARTQQVPPCDGFQPLGT